MLEVFVFFETFFLSKLSTEYRRYDYNVDINACLKISGYSYKRRIKRVSMCVFNIHASIWVLLNLIRETKAVGCATINYDVSMVVCPIRMNISFTAYTCWFDLFWLGQNEKKRRIFFSLLRKANYILFISLIFIKSSRESARTKYPITYTLFTYFTRKLFFSLFANGEKITESRRQSNEKKRTHEIQFM